ncbi:unnamed protein product [Schistocephalus solidus]|uniref:Gelsolin-like domain-containing protein n=1 Tax=Schistocephalus solidus TaxID=70667 RepID=A0A3P7DU04_SCHSO|nr:unnamed protein product [Schistocephalus solidus]
MNGMAEFEWISILNIKEEILRVWCLPGRDGTPLRIPDSDAGYFFSDEIFVVLKTFKRNTKMCYNIHFWIGKEKAQEMGASPPAKVKELMAVLNDNVVLFREIEGSESPQFKRYFKIFGVHKGSLNDVFDPKNPQAFKPKLLHFHLNKKSNRTEMFEVPISWKSLTSNDVFIYDEGTKMTQWNGSRCDEEERQAARQYGRSALKKRNCKVPFEFFDEEDLFEKNELRSKLGEKDVPLRPAKPQKKDFQKVMLRLSDETNRLVLTKVYIGKIYRDGINPDDVTFVEDFRVLFVYIGPGASEREKLSTWDEAAKYLKAAGRPEKAIAVFASGSYLPEFNEIWDDHQTKEHVTAESNWSDILNIKEEVLRVWCLSQRDGTPLRIPDNDVGYFFSDEIFVVLKTFRRNTKMCYNIHFWIGEEKAQEMGASPPAKVKELMAMLNDKVVLFREIEGFESPQFKQYFKVFGVHKGSLNDIFNPNDPKDFTPKLLHFHLNKKRNRTEMFEVPISWKSLTSNDVFIYDEGTKMTQWNGSRCDEEERQAARHYIASALKRRNCKATSEFYDEEDLFEKNELRKKLGEKDVPPMHTKYEKKGFQKVMLRLSDESGTLVLTKVYSGKIYRDGINPNDVTFAEDFNVLFVYIGPGASEREKLSAWDEAVKYLKTAGRPEKAIAVFASGSYLPEFNEIWNDQEVQKSAEGTHASNGGSVNY